MAVTDSVTDPVTGEPSGGAHAAPAGTPATPSRREPTARTSAPLFPTALVRSPGLTLDATGDHRRLDCRSGAETLTADHSAPAALEAVRQVLTQGTPLFALDLAAPIGDAFVPEPLRALLLALTDCDRARRRCYGSDGTDAVAAGLVMTRDAPSYPRPHRHPSRRGHRYPDRARRRLHRTYLPASAPPGPQPSARRRQPVRWPQNSPPAARSPDAAGPEAERPGGRTGWTGRTTTPFHVGTVP
ncbi:hypothetical protein ACWEKM_06760 [Streptomyces sp. NPDC004752]